MTILQNIFPAFVNNFFASLTTEVYSNSFVTFQYGWGVVHFLLVFALIFALVRSKIKRPIVLAFAIILLFELFEFLISYRIPIILKETIQDTFGDLVIGAIAIFVGYFASKQ